MLLASISETFRIWALKTLQDSITLKSLDITADLIQQYKKLEFAGVLLQDVISAKATGTTPSFISLMKEKGLYV